jgi:hypothetical protein
LLYNGLKILSSHNNHDNRTFWQRAFGKKVDGNDFLNLPSEVDKNVNDIL